MSYYKYIVKKSNMITRCTKTAIEPFKSAKFTHKQNQILAIAIGLLFH